MSLVVALKRIFKLPVDRPQLLVAQAAALSRQVPLLYSVVFVSAVTLAATHLRSAPIWLTVGATTVLGLACGYRTFNWWRSRHEPMNPERARRMLTSTIRSAYLMAAAFTAWSLALFPYGDAYSRSQVGFFMAITVCACILCLMHLPVAALIIVALALGPMVLFFWSTGQEVFQATAVNVALVGVAMVFMLFKHYREFTDLIASQTENTRLANHDSLTQLPNRRRFFLELDSRLSEARRVGGALVVGVVDLDGFKPVNDAFGHATGDRLLVEVAQRLRDVPEPALFVARLGGDEFGLIIDRTIDDAELLRFGKAICDLMQTPFDLPGVVAQIGCSVGFCPFPTGGENAQQLFERADYALYHAKQNLLGGDAVVFDGRHEAEIRELSQVDQAMFRADLEHEMSIAFQPIYDLGAERTVAFEALARWTSPELGVVPPGIFIRAAERSGQITEVTPILLRKALRAAVNWPMDMRIAINLSARDIASMDTVRNLVAIVQESLIAAHRIDFEITETAIVCDFEQARDALLALRELGARTVLDDFGTGHSSLSHVRLLPIDKLKIDASFVADIIHHQASEDIVKTVLELCRNMRLGCVVEGVEIDEQLTKIRDLGATEVQGYHFAKPMPETEVSGYLANESRARNGAAKRPSRHREKVLAAG